jgi:hypothetical protein
VFLFELKTSDNACNNDGKVCVNSTSGIYGNATHVASQYSHTGNVARERKKQLHVLRVIDILTAFHSIKRFMSVNAKAVAVDSDFTMQRIICELWIHV